MTVEKKADRPRILFVLPQIPYPPESGGRIVTWNTLRRFADDFDCWVACLYHHRSELDGLVEVRQRVREVMAFPAGSRLSPWRMLGSVVRRRPYKAVRFWNERMAEYIQQLIEREKIDIVHAQNFYAAQYITGQEPCLRVHYKENIEGRVMAQFARQAAPPLSWILPFEAWRTLSFERRLLRRYHRVLSISTSETELLRKKSRRRRTAPEIAHLRPGFDLAAHPLLPPPTDDPPSLIFPGTFSYPPNDGAARWFLNDVWSRIWTRAPGTRVRFVGNTPRPWLQEYDGKEGIEVTGRVPDMRPYYEKAGIVIIPLHVGGGVKLKLLEAMALGRPVIATSVGIEGLGVTPGREVEVVDDPVGFAERVLELLRDPERRRLQAERARQLVEKNHDWDTIVARQKRNYLTWLQDLREVDEE